MQGWFTMRAPSIAAERVREALSLLILMIQGGCTMLLLGISVGHSDNSVSS